MRIADEKQKRVSEEQINEVLRLHQAGAKPADLCRQNGVRDATLYNRRSWYGGMQVSKGRCGHLRRRTAG